MTSKEFANMPIKDLREYCDQLQRQLTEGQRFFRGKSVNQQLSLYYESIREELSVAHWFLRNRLMTASERKFKTSNGVKNGQNPPIS